MKKFISIAFLTFLFALAANAQTVSGSVGAATRGGAARGSVVLDIPAGLHVNSNRPSSENLIPTTVRVSAASAKVGAVKHPRGHNRKFSFSETPLNVYEGRVIFPFAVNVPANFKGNTVKVRAVVRFQACTQEVCYAPKTQEITLTAKVK